MIASRLPLNAEGTLEHTCTGSDNVANQYEFDFIHIAFRDFATKAAQEIDQQVRVKLELYLDLGRRLSEAKEKLTRRKEFTRFRDSLNLSTSDATKYMKLFEVFGEWNTEKLLVIASATSLFTLCSKKYAEVVEQLRFVPVVTKQFVQGLLKEVRQQAALERVKKRAESISREEDPSTGWKSDPSGGSRHYQILLYDEETSLSIDRQAEAEKILPQKVIAEGVALRANQKSGVQATTEQAFRVDEKQVLEQKLVASEQEKQQIVNEVRNHHVQMHWQIHQQERLLEERDRELVERDRTIADLETQLTNQLQQQNALISELKTQLEPASEQEPELLVNFDTPRPKEGGDS